MSTDCLQNSVTAYSISVWVNWSGSGGDRQVIFADRGVEVTDGMSLTLGIGHTGTGAGAAGDVFFVLDSDYISIGKFTTAPISANVWHHIVATWEAPSGTAVTSSQFKIYVDNELPSFTTEDLNGTSPQIRPVSPLSGRDDSQAGWEPMGCFFKGCLDELLVFDRALTEDEVRTLYGSGQGYYGTIATAPCATGLIAGYHFDEGQGTTVTDFSGNGHTGTLHGTVAWAASPKAVGMTAAYMHTYPTSGATSTHQITAFFTPVSNQPYPPGPSAPLSLTVNPLMTLSGDQEPATDQAASVIATFPADATGEVVFSENGATLGTARLGPAPSYALQFDGTSGYISTDCLQSAVRQYSVSAWVKTSATSEHEVLLANRGASGNAGVGLTLGLGKIGGWEGTAGDVFFTLESNYVLIGKVTRVTINDGVWHHVVGTWEGAAGAPVTYDQFEIYIDGVLQTSLYPDCNNPPLTGPDAPLSGGDGSQIGMEAGGGYFNGSMGELSIFDRALSQSNVNTLYAGGQGCYGTLAAGPCATGLVAGYHFDHTQGGESTTVADFSGNGYTGTLHDGVTWTPSSVAIARAGASYAALTTTFDAAGPYSITAAYSGDANYSSISAQIEFAVHNVIGREYYVDPQNGTDENNDYGTLALPFKTFWKARDKANQPGDTVFLRGGDYPMADLAAMGGSNAIYAGGAPGAPITYTNYPGETPVLDFSEQEPAWQYDASTGWWYATVPEDSLVRRGVNNDNRLHVYRKEGQLAVALGSLGEMTDSKYNPGGQLAYDLSYYEYNPSNPAYRTLYWRPSALVPAAGDVAGDLKLVSRSSELDVSYLCSYVTIQGLTLQFSASFQAAGEHLAILDNTITNFWGQGLVGPGANSVVEGNFIDRIGGPWAEGPGLNWPHCLYGGGDFSTIVDNFFGRSMDGNSVKIYGANHVVFDYNVVYEDDPHDHFHALEVTGGCSDVDIQHNVIVNPGGGGFAMSYGVDGVTFSNNYLESDSTLPALLAATDNAPTSVENFQITNNILNGYWGIHFQLNTVLAGSLVSRNQWFNTQEWQINVNGSPPQNPWELYSDYLVWVQANEPTWEQDSTWTQTAPTFGDPTAFEQSYLDGPEGAGASYSVLWQAYIQLWSYAQTNYGFAG